MGHNVNGVNVGSTADDEEHFINIRAENAWAVKSWVKTADLPKDEDFYQLSNIKYKWKSERRGQLKIESKEEMSKRGLESPDVFAALCLTFTGSAPSPFPEQGGKIVSESNEPETVEELKGKPDSAGFIEREF